MIGCHSGAISEAEDLERGEGHKIYVSWYLPDLGLGLLCCEDGDPSRDATEGDIYW
jgi:hypothetical protein